MLKVDNNTPSPFLPCLRASSAVLLISATALAVIGILAALPIPSLVSAHAYWYVFELGALVGFVTGLITCCKSFCNSQSDAENSDSVSPPSKLAQPIINDVEENEPQTAEDFYVLARQCVEKEGRKNYGDAVTYYSQAVNLGHIPSMYYLGKCYYKGNGVEEDKERAIEFFKQAAKQDHEKSLYVLASILLERNPDTIDQEAIKWIEKIAEKKANVKTMLETYQTFCQFSDNQSLIHSHINLLKKIIDEYPHMEKMQKKANEYREYVINAQKELRKHRINVQF